MTGLTDIDDLSKLDCISAIINSLKTISPFLPQRQPCGHFSLFVNNDSDNYGKKITYPVISIDMGKMRQDKLIWHPKYAQYKTLSLIRSTSISSFQIREDIDLKSLDENSEVVLGGAIKAGNNDIYSMGFAGMTEYGDEAIVVLAALKMNWIDMERVKQVIKISNNNILKNFLKNDRSLSTKKKSVNRLM